jgi:hypothetical protein
MCFAGQPNRYRVRGTHVHRDDEGFAVAIARSNCSMAAREVGGDLDSLDHRRLPGQGTKFDSEAQRSDALACHAARSISSSWPFTQNDASGPHDAPFCRLEEA